MKLATWGKQLKRIPEATLDVPGQIIVREVVSICHYVVVGTRIGEAAAELSDCNTQGHVNRLNFGTNSGTAEATVIIFYIQVDYIIHILAYRWQTTLKRAWSRSRGLIF